ncbi:hypothetical protein DL96DRAFT_1560023 [Flagelloscypha sp. PMI_526]|nr:hypothetical protein DL96DRAFT_1560023 [Flagelloscypha sp. PMI_526]
MRLFDTILSLLFLALLVDALPAVGINALRMANGLPPKAPRRLYKASRVDSNWFHFAPPVGPPLTILLVNRPMLDGASVYVLNHLLGGFHPNLFVGAECTAYTATEGNFTQLLSTYT